MTILGERFTCFDENKKRGTDICSCRNNSKLGRALFFESCFDCDAFWLALFSCFDDNNIHL